MASLRSFAGFCVSTSAVSLGAVLFFTGACSKDEVGASNTVAGQSSAGAPGAAGDAQSSRAGSQSSGGSSSAQAGASTSSAGEPTGAAGSPAGAAGAPSAGGDCFVQLSKNTSNATDAATPLTEMCQAITFDGQMNFEIYADGINRNLNIDFFESPVAGASVKLEDGNDPQAGKGAAASYLGPDGSADSGVWNADSGTISIVSVTNNVFVVKLTDVHFIVLPAPGGTTATGEFTANGTITAAAMPSK